MSCGAPPPGFVYRSLAPSLGGKNLCYAPLRWEEQGAADSFLLTPHPRSRETGATEIKEAVQLE